MIAQMVVEVAGEEREHEPTPQFAQVVRDIVAELADAIYNQPGHSITLPSIPPDNVLRRFRWRVDGVPHTYMMVAGLVDNKWRLYSNLVKNKAD